MALDGTRSSLSMLFCLQMNLIVILSYSEIIYMDYLKSTESMKAGLCPSNKGCGSSEVMGD